MFKIGETPSLSADPTDHADYLEFECLRKSDGKASGQDLIAALNKLADDAVDERQISDERYENIVDAAFTELKCRSAHSGRSYYRYPFRVSEDNQLLEFTGRQGRCEFYLFLLLATRMNMKSHRVQANINGTELFEQVCCEVAKNYWGKNTEGLVFGTARRNGDDEVGNFQAAVTDLCTRIREGVGFFNHSEHPPQAKDGKLDVVVWKDFADQRHGKLIGFGQCKTGTHWAKEIHDLVPEGFCRKWVRTAPVVMPVRLYFITSRVRDSDWYDACVDAGIFFDRCRILNYAPTMPTLRQQWVNWVTTGMAVSKLAIPAT